VWDRNDIVMQVPIKRIEAQTCTNMICTVKQGGDDVEARVLIMIPLELLHGRPVDAVRRNNIFRDLM
jgi:hypothetical protein